MMQEYRFKEAAPLVKFIESHETDIIGQPLKNLYIDYWPNRNRSGISDRPVVLELGNRYIVVYYLVPSDLRVLIGDRVEIEKNKDVANILNIKTVVRDYYNSEFGDGIPQDEIEGCLIENIEIKRFSEAFECDPITEEIRPDGGDYFSTIRIYLDSGTVLCLRGADSIMDGYIEIWCE